MPTDLIHRIGVAAPVETIYRAITTEDGIRAWWMTDVKMDASAAGATSLQKLIARNFKLRQERHRYWWGERPREPLAALFSGSPGVSPHRVFRP